MSGAAARAAGRLAPEVQDEVRRSVRRVLERAPAYAAASPDEKRALARGLVEVGMVAAGLVDEERAATDRARKRPRLATAQSAGDQMSMTATRAAAGTLTGIRDAIDFPTYVGSLITGVFQAILNSSATQVGVLGDLVDGVATSAEDFASSVSDGEVVQWLVGKFPRLLRAGPDGVQEAPGVDLSEHASELQKGLGSTDGDLSDASSLVDIARAKMARDKQATLATMMQLGLQRIVVDEGRIHASMDLRVDAQSGSQEARQQRDDWRVNAGVEANFAVGPWGAKANTSTSVGQVKSDAQYTTEQIGLRAGLRSSVDLAFRTDQVPIDKFANQHSRVKLDLAARVPADVAPTGGGSVLTGPPADFKAPSLDVPGTPSAPTAPAPPGKTPAEKKTPPVADKTPPPADKTPPPADKTPPPADKTPPPADKTPPPADKTPPPANPAAGAAGAAPRAAA